MAYTRKTHDEFEVQIMTADGWECCNTETTWLDGRRSLREYRENDPRNCYRLKKVRVENATDCDHCGKSHAGECAL